MKRLEVYADTYNCSTDYGRISERVLLTTDLLDDSGEGTIRKSYGADVAYIQYSSGSTGDPKGVTLTHLNLITNAKDIISRSKIFAADSLLSWMPLTRDMGLICFHLTGVIAGVNEYIMPTALFIRRPVLWLELADEYRCTLLYSPNFGLQYFLNAFKPVSINWDLSYIRLIYNGAEPISFALCNEFCAVLGKHGLQKNVMYPGYGLAEASVPVSLPRVGSEIKVYSIAREGLEVGKQIRHLELMNPAGLQLVDLLIVNIITNSIRFIQSLEVKNDEFKRKQARLGEEQNRKDNLDDLPF